MSFPPAVCEVDPALSYPLSHSAAQPQPKSEAFLSS
jgi:hypothetical protein